MEALRPPLPLHEAGRYGKVPKPEWRVRYYIPTSLGELPYHLKLKFVNLLEQREGTLVFRSAEPGSVEELQSYVDYLLNRAPRPSFFAEVNEPGYLQFSSGLEGGNLHEAYCKFANDYSLFLRSDSNTQGHTQWFYFQVRNADNLQPTRFSIRNIRKSASLFKKGMKPWVYSQQEQERSGKDWDVLDTPIEFYRNSDAGKKTYTLAFTYAFAYPHDTVWFAFANPYPYSKLNSWLTDMETRLKLGPGVHENSFVHYKREELCKSLGGLPVPKLTITAPRTQGVPLHKRKAVVLAARVHPAETNGSFVMEGALEFLLSEHKFAYCLREHYVFYVVPMLNPDGVVCGNSRCGLIGIDLNRRWDNPDCLTNPTIHHCKEMIRHIAKKKEILMFCDFHAHSKKKNAFIYGCNLAANEGFTSWTKVRLFPRILAGLTPYFSFPNCKFRVEPDKLGTGRIVLWKEFNITNSFTLECSAFCYKQNNQKVLPKQHVFYPANLKELGACVLLGIYDYHFALENLRLELKINGGWLKPNRLKEISGVPAQVSAKPTDARLSLTAKPTVRGKAVADWRDFFRAEELAAGEEFVEDSPSSGSDSSPSEDELEDPAELEFTESPAKPDVLPAEECKASASSQQLKKLTKRAFVTRVTASRKVHSHGVTPAPHHINLDLEAVYLPIRSKVPGKYVRRLASVASKEKHQHTKLLNPLVIKSLKTDTSCARRAVHAPQRSLSPYTKSRQLEPKSLNLSRCFTHSSTT